MPGDTLATKSKLSISTEFPLESDSGRIDSLGIIKPDQSPADLVGHLISIAKEEERIIAAIGAAVRRHDVDAVFALAAELTKQ
jgi:hypothetical protein